MIRRWAAEVLLDYLASHALCLPAQADRCENRC